MSKDEKKTKKVLTDNRLVTVNKREISYESLLAKFETNEDGFYNLISTEKNLLLTPKYSITPQDIKDIPDLKKLQDDIKVIEAQYKKATGQRKFLLKKQLIEMRRDQYIIKSAYKPFINCINAIKSINTIDLDETITLNEKKEPVSNCLINLFNPKHVSALLCNYSALKEDVDGKFWNDAYYLMLDLDNLIEKALRKNNFLLDLLIYKIDGLSNLDIQKKLEETYGIKRSVEYISSLWRNKIPKMIADCAKREYIWWYYKKYRPYDWKECSQCGQEKPVHNYFFSINSTSIDGFYSICKECRNRKGKKCGSHAQNAGKK